MSVVKMRLVNFVNLEKDINNIDEFAIKYFLEGDGFHPEFANSVLDNVNGMTQYVGYNPYTDYKRRCNELLKKWV